MRSGSVPASRPSPANHALWFAAIMLPTALFTYGIGELSFFAPGQRLTLGGFPAAILIFALSSLGLSYTFLGAVENRIIFLIRWIAFMISVLLLVRYVLVYPIAMLLFGIGEGMPREQPARLLAHLLVIMVAAGPIALALALGQKLIVPSIGSARLWFLLHFATIAAGFGLNFMASPIRLNYHPLAGVLLAVPALPYAVFAPLLLEIAPVGGKRLAGGLVAPLLLSWVAVYLVWRADERPVRDAALWPMLAATRHLSFEERQALGRAMWRQRDGEPMRIGRLWYEFPEGWVRVTSVQRSDRYPRYGSIQMYVDLSGLVRGWPPDRGAALVRLSAASGSSATQEDASCPGESDLVRRLRNLESAWPYCNARWGHRGIAIYLKYPITANDHLPEIRANVERLLDRHVVKVETD